MCVDAVTTCHSALGRVPGNERLVFVVDPRELRAGELKFGAGTVIEHELASRLHGARVSTIEIDRAASIRDLSRFCEDVHAPRGDEGSPTLAETLVEHGVDRIVLTMAHRPEVLHIGSPTDARTLRPRTRAEPPRECVVGRWSIDSLVSARYRLDPNGPWRGTRVGVTAGSGDPRG